MHFWELHLIIYRSVLNYSCHWIQIYAAIDLEGKILNDLGSVFGDPQVKENLTLVLLNVARSHLLRLSRSLLFRLICILCACATNRLPECITDLQVLKTFEVEFCWATLISFTNTPYCPLQMFCSLLFIYKFCGWNWNFSQICCGTNTVDILIVSLWCQISLFNIMPKLKLFKTAKNPFMHCPQVNLLF